MKKVIGLCLVLMCFCSAYSQAKLNFCASVEPNGHCNFDNVKFITSPDSTNGRVFMQVTGTKGTPIGATDVIFKIYRIDKSGAEKFESMLQQAIKPDWVYAWMPYVFASPAKYDVKIYNESDELICSKMFELIAFSK